MVGELILIIVELHMSNFKPILSKLANTTD